ncbi:unnamed protein product [Rodentolepis nana]|uniref:Death domain-associated protein 6 n=1 Tax=Rodentolepis nana TaxID=102285 RepID=A0A0R3TA23_RODNA|nr:unnamed protein product [Rodentolepis nana]
MNGVPFKLTRDCRTGDSDDIMSRYSVHPKSREAIEDELDELLLGDDLVIMKLTRMFHSTSSRFQDNPETVQLLQDFIKRIRSSPLDAYPMLLELKLIFNKNLRQFTEPLAKTRSQQHKLMLSISTRTSSNASLEAPPKRRRVEFTTLVDSPQSIEIDQEDEEEKDRDVVSSVRKRIRSVKSSNLLARPNKRRKSVAKVQRTDSKNFYELRNLERTMLHISNEIQQLEEAEVDFSDEENSEYLRIDVLKRQELKLWREYCRLKGSNPNVARFDRQAFRYNGSRFTEINKAVEKLVKSSPNMPDYPDVRNLVVDLYSTLSPHSSPKAIDQEAQRIFVEVCQKLKNRREMEFQRDLFRPLPSGVDQSDPDADPALHSFHREERHRPVYALQNRCPLLSKCVSKLIAFNATVKVIMKYSRLQEMAEAEATDSNENTNEDQPSPFARITSDEWELQEPIPTSTQDAQISCPVFEESEGSGEIPPPEIPRSVADSSNSSPCEMIVISDGEEDVVDSNENVGDDDDDEPEIVGVEYHPPPPPPRQQSSHSAGVSFSHSQPTIRHTTINNRRYALPLENGSTMFVAMAQQCVVQVQPRSS